MQALDQIYGSNLTNGFEEGLNHFSALYWNNSDSAYSTAIYKNLQHYLGKFHDAVTEEALKLQKPGKASYNETEVL